MQLKKIHGGSVAAVAVAALFTASPALALSEASVACRAAIAKNYGKLVSTAVKTIAGCHKSRDKDASLAAVDCNDVTSNSVDSKGKFSGAVTKFKTAVDAACNTPAVADELLSAGEPARYLSCPVDTCTGVTHNPMTSMGEVSSCLGCMAASITGDAADTTLGMPTVPLSKEEAKCHAAITKGWGKYLTTAVKTENSCQGDSDDLGTFSLTGCVDDDPKGKAQGAADKANAGLDKACVAPVNLANLDGCANDTLGNFKTCTEAAWTSAENDTFEVQYETESTICPSTVRTKILGQCSIGTDGSAGSCPIGSVQTGTQLSVGWKGLGHGLDITDSYILAGDVTCPGTEKGTCGTCTIDGISTDSPQYQSFLRCVADTSIECHTPFGNDALCPSSGACRYFLGPPLAISAGGTPTCTLNVVDSDISGTVDPDTGTSSFAVSLLSRVHLGVAGTRPCPICRGDVTAQDGVRNGTCLGGAHDGGSCDVQGFDLSFARPTDFANPTIGNSLDCPPDVLANISGQGLAISLPLTTGNSSKQALDPCDPPNGAKDCFCGVCSHDPGLSCETDQFCDLEDDNNDTNSSSSCEGTVLGQGTSRKPNNCSNGICTAVTSDRGICEADVDSYCTGALFANGNGVIACANNVDCDSYVVNSSNADAWNCEGNDCGTCTQLQFRSCFNDPIVVTGTPSTTNPILAGTFCLPPSTNGTVNNATGSPGPGAVQTDSLVELRYN